MKSKDGENKEVTEDLSGKDRVIKNVVTSWGSHLILIVIGFIMPRMIDDHLGQVSLGIWDLSWSFVNYLSLAGFSVGSSVNRYVAKYRAQNDYQSLNRSLSSVVFIQFLIALTVFIGTLALVWFLPGLVGQHEGVDISHVRWVVALLGFSLAIQMIFDTSRGLMTGMHRWGLYNSLSASAQIVTAVLMVLVMLLGGNLIGLAIVYFVITSLFEIIRSILATRMCDGLDLRREFINFHDIKKMFKFGAKSMISASPKIIVAQTINIYIASILGPSALAVFARPLALVKHVETFSNKYSFVLTPMVGSISASNDKTALKAFLIESTKYSVAFSLPILLFIGALGDHILQIWMGKEYAHRAVILVLCIGYLLPIAQGPSLRVLMGMNMHGRVAMLNLILAIGMLVIGILTLNHIGWELQYVALLMSVIFTLTLGIITPVYACRRVGVGYFHYLVNSFKTPFLCALVLFVWLILCRGMFVDNSLMVVVAGALGSPIIMAVLYWFFLLPQSYKLKMLKRFA